MKSPYSDLPPRNFWRTGVSEAHPLTVENLYKKKFPIGRGDKIATAGSCFAQHVANHLRDNGFSVMDVEPPPDVLSDDVARSFGYKIYSARYGNIYTVRQLLQLARDADNGEVDEHDVWEKDGRFYDALRPNLEPNGFESVAETLALRRQHLARVKELFAQMQVFIFTLGLTEAWVDKRTGRVYPTAPGTIAGSYDPEIHEFQNLGFNEIYGDFVKFIQLVRAYNPGFKVILTVSPVALTATASDEHVLLATTYSKSVLRAAAGALAKKFNRIDYFPSYEIIASPWSRGFFYEPNMRSVSAAGVSTVMRVFFGEHGQSEAHAESRKQRRVGRAEKPAREPGTWKEPRKASQQKVEQSAEDAICEDLLLEAFAPEK
ncbi:MAG TPA: GSCFA domain-containing protein [Rhizomicrobium sp.]|nr:GSCFA domain-containing protein [Rhizomicrobium sp.]